MGGMPKSFFPVAIALMQKETTPRLARHLLGVVLCHFDSRSCANNVLTMVLRDAPGSTSGQFLATEVADVCQISALR